MMSETAPIRVFLVDDHPAVRQGLGLVLSEQGFEVCGEAEDRTQTLEHPQLASADIVLVDLALAHETGIPLIEELCNLGRRVVVYSMYEDANQVEQAMVAGACGYVTKRETTHMLAEAAREVLAGRRFISPRAGVNLAMRSSGKADPLDTLSQRERQIFDRLGQGHATGEIAQEFNLSSRTVESYCSRVLMKLGLSSMRELRRMAIQHYHASLPR